MLMHILSGRSLLLIELLTTFSTPPLLSLQEYSACKRFRGLEFFTSSLRFTSLTPILVSIHR